VTFSFENGALKLVTVIDPVSGCHTVVIYVINPFHLAFRQPVSHCLIIGELIPARGVLLREIKKRQKSEYW
jgi:hypothetical protein